MEMAGVPDEVMSTLHSWHWNRGDFDAQWRFVRGQWDAGIGDMLSRTRFKEVRALAVPGGNGDIRVAFKVYREKRFWRYLFRPSLAAREARGFAAAAKLGIPLVEILACGERRRRLNLLEAYFVTAFAEGTRTLEYFHEHPEQRGTLLALLKENIVRLGQLHAAGYIHGGMHPRNVLWRESGDGGADSIWIDLATVRAISVRRPNWKYVLTDLTDLTEKFELTQPELDQLAAEYRKVCDFPVAYEVRTDNPWKFSRALRCR
ncbi:MAG: lipopolysaccharide kinase InaA family protein [Lentisphaeria bacterium]|nr:lipopolysaccharide kinase InaA family protein [Lentisphaeria bacterium]